MDFGNRHPFDDRLGLPGNRPAIEEPLSLFDFFRIQPLEGYDDPDLPNSETPQAEKKAGSAADKPKVRALPRSVSRAEMFGVWTRQVGI